MVTIVLIEDDEKDISLITEILQPLKGFLNYELKSFMKIEQGKEYIAHHNVQLVLLDLEFTLQRKTSLYLINQISPSVPIIVVSNLTHYQRQLRLRANVVAFIPKAKMKDLLVRSIAEVLCDINETSRPADFLFPAVSPSGIPEGFSIADFRWLELYAFREYEVHLTSGQVRKVASCTFKDLVKAIKDQDAADLQPISRFQIVNTNYIAKVYLQDNSRVTITLVGCNDEFHVGKNYAKLFRDWYIE